MGFSLTVISVIWPLRILREIPLRIATWMGELAYRRPAMPPLFIALLYFVIPAIALVAVHFAG